MNADPFKAPTVPWYKNVLFYAVVIIGVVIIAFVVYNIFYKPPVPVNNSQQLINQQLALYQNRSYWGPSSDIPGDPRSQCGIYTFEGFINDGIAIQGPITINTATLDNCGTTGSSCIGPTPAALQSCLDNDQIAVRRQQRTCTPQGTDAIGCRDFNGDRYQVGEVNVFYEPCVLNPCTTTNIGSVAVNFQFNPDPEITLANARCIYPVFFGTTGSTGATGATGNTGTTNIGISGAICDLSLPQLWRITRATYLPQTKTFKQDPKGQFARIQNRESNLCLAPILGTTGTTGSTGTTGATNGNLLTLGPCVVNRYPWLLAPSLNISGLITPQQLVYAPNPAPFNTQGDIISYINTYHPVSLVVEGNNAILRPFALDNTTQPQYSAQFIDYALFNLITTDFYPF